jgi:uncharacterized membrane protein HdeD (DUF308 family)
VTARRSGQGGPRAGLVVVALAAVVANACCGGPILANPPLTFPSPIVATPGPARAADPIPIALPRDDGPHDRLTEWWYYTGHLQSASGHRFGFEAVVFRAERGAVPAAWASHVAITDEGTTLPDGGLTDPEVNLSLGAWYLANLLDEYARTFESKINEAVSEGERMLARVWKIIAANGAAAVLFGFVLVLWPDIGLATIVAVVAVYALVRGVLSGLAAFSAPLPQDERRWLALEVVAGTAIGIALLVWNDISAQALLYVVAAWALAIGALMLGTAMQAPLEWPAKLLLALNGIISSAFGAVMFIEPDVGAVAIVALIAAYIIVIGVMQVGFVLELRQLVADVRDRLPRPTATAPVAHG